MKRRGLLGGLAGVLAGAGCLQPASSTGPRTPPRSPEPTATPATGLVVVEFDDEADDAGNLRLLVTVENRTGDTQSGTVVVDVTAGDTETTVRRDVTVAASARVEVTLSTDVPYDKFTSAGSLQIDVT
jgi:hypothetical protein